MLMTGGCLVQLDRFHPSTWWQSSATSRATAFHYLGVMPAMLLKAPATDRDDFRGALRFAFGAGVDPRHHAAFEARFGVPLIEAWAMTETGAGAWITANHEPRHSGSAASAGRRRGWPIASSMMRERYRAGHRGRVAGATRRRRPRRGFFSGYYKDEAATEQAWRGGWFHTGDLVRHGRDGSFFFVDRSKNIVSAQRREYRGRRSRKRAANPSRRHSHRPSVRCRTRSAARKYSPSSLRAGRIGPPARPRQAAGPLSAVACLLQSRRDTSAFARSCRRPHRRSSPGRDQASGRSATASGEASICGSI